MIVATSTAATGTCGTCSSPLDPGQRYCIACGARRGELPFRVPEREEAPALGRAGRSFGAVGAVVLAVFTDLPALHVAFLGLLLSAAALWVADFWRESASTDRC